MTRFACINALHLQLVPEFAKSQRLMNFANNNPEEFRQSRIPFVIGLIQFLISLFSEIVNLWLLQSYDDVFRCIIHYVTMAVVCDLSKIYYAALGADQLKDVFKTPVLRKNHGTDIEFSERRCFHKGARIVYKIVRGFYISVIFSLVPFSSVLVPFFLGFPFQYQARP